MKTALASIRGHIFRLQCWLFRRNIKIGRGLRIYKKLSIVGNGRVSLGDHCTIGGAPGDSSQYVTIDTHARDAVIQIGHNAALYAARISAKYEIILGNDVLIEQAGMLDTDFHSIDKTRKTPEGETKERCRIVIGDRVCIGMRSFVTRGVMIGDDAIIVPGSVVNASVKAGSIMCGNPAKAIFLEGQA